MTVSYIDVVISQMFWWDYEVHLRIRWNALGNILVYFLEVMVECTLAMYWFTSLNLWMLQITYDGRCQKLLNVYN